MNQTITKFVSLLLILSTLIQAAPVVVTRYHTAANHATVTETQTTGTTTVTQPVVEIFISNGVTYTFTLTTTATGTDVAAAATQTVVLDDDSTSTLAEGESVPTTTTSPTITSTPTTTAAEETTSSSSSDWTSTTETITLTTTVTLDDGSESTSTSTGVTTKASPASTSLTETETSTSSTETTSTSSTETTTSSTETTTSSTETTSTSSTETTSSATASASITTKPTAIVYSPYNDDGSCKDSDTVYSDLQKISGKNIPNIRVYGTDCNSIETVQPAAIELGLKINQGFWMGSAGVDSIDDSVSDLIDWAADNSWDVIDYITIGNEAIQNGYASVSDLIDKISSVKSQLKAAGYTGKVTTSEPPVVFENNPELCTDSEIDFVGINSHSYFDVNSAASDAGTFVAGQIDIVKNICGDLDVVVTETGYPSKGNTNGKNVPSTANQEIALKAILDVVGTDVTILSTYDDLWKSPGDYGIEQSFGSLHWF